jgi:gliding motility-associated-like protein
MVKDTALFSAPNAFMPNGSDENRILYVKGKGIKQLLEFNIYNRWGNLVFQSNDLSIGWDGKFKGKDQPIDTYIYTITIETMSGQRLTKKGSVLLIR